MSTDLLARLLETVLAGSAAIVLVLAVRGTIRARFGSSAAYSLWWLVPIAILATLLPERTLQAVVQSTGTVSGVPRAVELVHQMPVTLDAVLLWGWFAGAIAMALLLSWQQWRFRVRLGRMQHAGQGMLRAQGQDGLPAVMGVLLPRIVLPRDFETRYDSEEQRLVLQHERIHRLRGDLQANAAFALLRCLHWFNPLAHLAAERFRWDQELACDESVIRRNPGSRRAYGEAMLKTQLAGNALPFGCHWRGQHSLKERITMLKRQTPTNKQRRVGMLVCLIFAMATGFSVWAAQPARNLGQGGPDYLVSRQSFYGDQASGMLNQYTKSGNAVTSIVGTGAERWQNAMTLAPGAQPGTVMVRMEISRGDPAQVVARPATMVREGETGAVEQSDEQGNRLYRQEFKIVRVRDGDAATDISGTRNADVASGSKESQAVLSQRLPPPRYPAEAAANKIIGKVVLIVDVANDGSVAAADIEKSEPAGVFDQAVLEAAEQWKFTPAMRDGKPVPGRVRVPVYFDMDKDSTPGSDGLAG